MKKCIFVLTVLLLVSVSTFAQTMTIKLKNGGVLTYPITDIEKISFSDSNGKNANPADIARDNVIAQMSEFVNAAKEYFRKPTSLGGGGNSLKGFALPENLMDSPEGKYTIKVENDSATITGTAKVKKDNGKYPKVEMKIGSEMSVGIKNVVIVE